MALAHVHGYLASDGKFFFKDRLKDAEIHEANLEFQHWCSNNICIGGEWSSRMVADKILQHWVLLARTRD